MAKTQDPVADLAAELELLRQEDEVRAQRVRRIEALQLPIAAEVVEIMRTRSILDARDLLAEKTASLTDNLNLVVRGLVSQIDNAQTVLINETKRIAAQIEADAAAAKAKAEAAN